MHEFWLADIRDACIISLDLLIRWGARVDMAGAAITIGSGPGEESTGALAAGGAVIMSRAGGSGRCPVPALGAALCLPPSLPPGDH